MFYCYRYNLKMADTAKVAPENAPLIPEESKRAAAALGKLFFFSTLMFTLPFGGFYGTKYLLKEHFTIIGFNNTLYAVVVSVIIVNMIIAAFTYVAFKEDDGEGGHNQSQQHKKD